MASPKSLKRTYEEAELETQSPGQHHSQERSMAPPTIQAIPDSMNERSLSGAFTQPNVPVPNLNNAHSSPSKAFDMPLPPGNRLSDTTQKSKLTFAEKEVRRIEKEYKDQQRAEEKVKREEERLRRERDKNEKEQEKAKKIEERRLKDEDRRKAKEERERVKAEEKAKKEEEKQKREEEKNKKARSQLRLNAFFSQPPTNTRSSTASPPRDAITPLSSRRGSVDESDAAASQYGSRSLSETPKKSQTSDFERAFPPFFLQSHTFLAPINRFRWDQAGLAYVRSKIDEDLKKGKNEATLDTNQDLNKLLNTTRKRLRFPRAILTVKNIIVKIDGAAQNPVDLTDPSKKFQRPSDLLKSVPMKFLKFKEDVRPPYVGTHTKLTAPSERAKLARNPFCRSLPEANYDYDSEAEWEEPGEGEDLDSEGEEELDDEDDGEMEGFLDDDQATDAQSSKRRPLLGDLEPTCTGICWAEQKDGPDLTSFSIDMLSELPSFPIDPYSTSYWQQSIASKPPASVAPGQTTLMEPPRVPLQPINGSNNLLPLSQNLASASGVHGSISNPSANDSTNPPKRLISKELVDDFKAAVAGSDLTKIGLVEQLKKKFPKQSKDVIRHSLDAFAERVGEKLADKHWILR